ncbi:MAG: hypothetical protein COU47_01005 [Candidatus Niyogibacteria bacterium CG10_big_fil_rev_8_21_14_0_10_46_36]|uniref:Orotate phosphoribosyltransferase n=1 Tax=Candidatus Niyogibacteria bacterium CG10_big_fil_rev_8_21_14_0_10_46_36 TaxID=1974726 RepID=A0A2H0TEM5_9BACT|nr:MAG: hypothetical protein COU47_01005 [Candidatus Niyogibacteria bacterium CG10_big_fil_rev_8_21_14_0_10_46_36]
MKQYIKTVSETFDLGVMNMILRTKDIFFDDVHVLYPADCDGSHLTRFFMIEKVLSQDRDNDFWMFVATDICSWIRREKIDFDFVFAPAQPGVLEIAKILAREFKKQYALWEYHPTGRFGNKVVGGKMVPFGRALMFNGMSAQGRCIGDRLPSFLKQCQAYPVAAAVFAKGTTGLVEKVEREFGSRFYSTIQIDIPVYKKEDCPECAQGKYATLQRWIDL